MAKLDAVPASRALTVIVPGTERPEKPLRVCRPDSRFLAQMIAAEAGAAQYRMRRREIPAVAVAAYRSASRLAEAGISFAA